MCDAPQEPELSEFSPITHGVLRFFDLIKYISVMRWLSFCSRIFRSRSELTKDEIGDPGFITHRARAIEMYLLGWLFAEFVLVIFFCAHAWPAAIRCVGRVIVALRIIEIIQVSVNATIFDAINGRPENLVASSVRMIVLAGINFLELLACFGIIYASDYASLSGAGQPITAFYFSGITQLTIGYGDVIPKGWLRIVALIQGLVGTLFLILIFGRFVSALRPIDNAFKSRT